MEFCGGHTHAISRYGVADFLPPNVRMIHGRAARFACCHQRAHRSRHRAALEQGVILCSYGDTLRVPGIPRLSLLKAKARGGDIA